jgi:hypothetical protein
MNFVPLALGLLGLALLMVGLVIICAPAVLVASGILLGRIAYVLDKGGPK